MPAFVSRRHSRSTVVELNQRDSAPLKAGHPIDSGWAPYTLTLGEDVSYLVHTALKKMFSLPDEAVRVRTFNLGGSFGAKGGVKI